MAEDANANIRIDIDTTAATAALKALQGQIARFHTEMARGGAVAGQNASKLQQDLINSINAGGQFQAGMTKVQSTTEAFTTALEKNKLSMGQYFRYAGASTKTFGRFFRGEFETITKVATERVKDLQTQYISMGRDANGALRSIKVRPLVLDMQNLETQAMITAQKQQLFNQLLKQGSTNLLNFGKNTQWAGRQLMVGFTLPLSLFASTAAKSFMEIEKQIIKIRRVYGDFSTTVAETDQMIDSIKTLAGEYTKYGVAVSDTLGLAAEAAAAGKSGQELLAQISQATRLAVLGNVEQTQALETTMSVTNAFGVATEDLASKIDFLNAVENQSVTSIEDLTIAIPKAGPVVQQLGGDVEDLAFFLTAMKEGGINASEGANALKSGLASLINPTGKAKEMLQGFGINIEKIVQSNKGDIKGLVVDFASSLDTLDPLSRARAIEQLFGKFQFSRLSTLFQNVIGEGTQASRVLELTKATTQELAILSQRELKKVEETTTYKFEKAFADFQAALAPVGEEFLKAITPVIEFGTKLLNQFNNMGDGAKSFAVILTTVVAGIGPVLLMTVGLVANGVANLIKMFQMLGNIFRRSGADTTTLGLQTDYMTQQQLEAAAVAASLNQSHSRLAQTFSVEAASLNALTAAYQKAVTAQRGFAMPGGRVAGSATKPKKYAGGVVSVPGPKGKGDVVPAMLSPGEAVIPAEMAKKYAPIINGMVAGNIPGYNAGKTISYGSTSLDVASSGNIDNFNKLIKSVESGAAGIDNGSAVLQETFKRLSSEGKKVSFRDFSAELMHVSDGLSKVGLSVNKVNTILGSRVVTQKAVGQSAAYNYATSSDPIMKAEYERSEAAAKAALEARKAAGLGPGQLAPDGSRQQIDRAHQVNVSGAAKQTGQGWAQPFWVLQASDENQMSEQLKINESLRKEYLGKLKEENISTTQKAEITRKITSGLALTDKELMIQKRILERMLVNQNSVLNTRKSESLKGYAVGTVAAAGAREKYGITATSGSRPKKDVAAAQQKLNDRLVPVVASPANKKLAGQSGAAIVDNLESDAAKGMADRAKTKSPSRVTRKIGEDTAQGYIDGLQSGAKRAKRESGRVQTGVPGAGGFPVKTTSAGSQIIIGDTGRYLQEDEKPSKKPRTPKEQAARDKMIRRRAMNVKMHSMGGRIAAGVKGMGGMGAGMGLAMAGGSLAMIPGLEGLGTAAGLAGSAMMMIPGPVGIVVASLIGLVGIIMSVQAAQEKQKQAAIDLANAQIMSMDKLNTMAEDFGTVSATEARIAAEDAAAAGVTQETINAGKQYLTEMASGQQIIEDIKTQQSAGIGSSEIGQNVAADMATAVSQGVVTQQQAQEIIAALGSLTGDRSITANASQQFRTYMEDPTKAPGMIASDRLAMVQRQFAGATTQSTQAAQYTTVAGEQVLVSPEKTTSSITDPNAAAGAVSATMNAYGQAVGGIDAINAKAAADIQEAKTTKEISEIVKQRNIDLAAQKVIIEETYAELEKQKTTVTATKFDDAFLNSFDKDSDMYNTAIEINKMKDSDIKMQFQADFAGGNMSQATAESIIGAVDSEQALIGYYKLKVAVETDRKDDALISRLLGVPTKAMAPDKPKKEKDPVVTGGDSSGGSSTPPEDKVLTQLQAKLDKRSKALNIISLQEAKINKKYDERKKALEQIAKLNSQIAEQQRSQLDIADALSRGDIAAAARAVQAERTRAAAFAQEQQMASLEEQRKRELSSVEFKGKTREELEKQMADLQMRIAKREYKNAAGGGLMRYSAGGRAMSYFAAGGSPLGSDTIPAMLTPGEFVIKRPAVKNFGVKNLEAINNGNSPSSGVYNYSISVNVSTDANPDQIARAVAQNVKRTDSYRIRGNKL